MKESEKIYQEKIIRYTKDGIPIRKMICINDSNV